MPISNNPLLQHHQWPPFDEIKPDQIVPAIETIIAKNEKQLQTLLQQDILSWTTLIEPLEKMDLQLSYAWSPVSHLHSVMDSDELREAYDACLPLLSAYSTAMGQNRELYEAYQQIRQHQAAELDDIQVKILDDSLRDFKLAGVALEGQPKQRYGEIKKELSKLTSQYEKNLLDATMAWHKNFANKEALDGLPESALEQAKNSAKLRKESGYSITLEFPSYYAVITYANDRELREEIYRAYSTRASDQGPDAGTFDNSKLMQEILSLRYELAELLDFPNYSELSLATKMAQNSEQVFGFLQDLAKKSHKQAKQELATLQQFAEQKGFQETLQAWDISYYSEKLKQEQYAFNSESLRPYFPENNVLKGLFEITSRLYGVQFKEESEIKTWHHQVRYFHVLDSDNNIIAGFYLDLYARPHKRGGAWMDDCRQHFKLSDGEKDRSVAYLTCNFNSPIGDKPALFTHDEVVTLFHEFGHGLHHMLTQINYPQVSGIAGVPWDAVELPSQFNENFCYHPETLKMISGHFETDETLPERMIDKLIAARNFQSAMMMVRQLEFALFDFHLHHDFSMHEAIDIQAVLDTVRGQVAVIKTPEFNRFQNGFSHIFAGGYAAGYYSYKWAEVLSADAFGEFEKNGILDSKTGKKFLDCILSKGGSDAPMKLFIKFRGREPSIEPLLRQSGILLQSV